MPRCRKRQRALHESPRPPDRRRFQTGAGLPSPPALRALLPSTWLPAPEPRARALLSRAPAVARAARGAIRFAAAPGCSMSRGSQPAPRLDRRATSARFALWATATLALGGVGGLHGPWCGSPQIAARAPAPVASARPRAGSDPKSPRGSGRRPVRTLSRASTFRTSADWPSCLLVRPIRGASPVVNSPVRDPVTSLLRLFGLL